MIILKADSANAIFIDINGNQDVANGVNSYFYFNFVNDMTKQARFKELAVAELTPRRYKFTFTEPTDIDFANQYGFYTYTIYQDDSTGLTNTNSFTSKQIVHQGKMQFSKTGVSEVSYTEYQNTDNTNTTNTNTQYISI